MFSICVAVSRGVRTARKWLKRIASFSRDCNMNATWAAQRLRAGTLERFADLLVGLTRVAKNSGVGLDDSNRKRAGHRSRFTQPAECVIAACARASRCARRIHDVLSRIARVNPVGMGSRSLAIPMRRDSNHMTQIWTSTRRASAN